MLEEKISLYERIGDCLKTNFVVYLTAASLAVGTLYGCEWDDGDWDNDNGPRAEQSTPEKITVDKPDMPKGHWVCPEKK